jgi:uncharacterized protein (DUF58 family)
VWDTMSGLTLATGHAGASNWSRAARWPEPGGGLDRLVRRPVVVLGLAAAVALAAFVLATPRALPMLGGLLATLGIGVAGPWLSLAWLRGQITFGVARCRVGDRVGFDLALTRFGRPVRAEPVVAWHTACDSDSETMSPRRRGRFPQPGAGPWLASDWPFGLVTARRQLEVPRPLIVRPRTSTVRFPGGMVAARRLGRDASVGLPGQAGDVLGVREYRPGDSVRSIHWTQTARRDEVVVCERPGTAAARVRILLDGSPGRGDEPGCEPCKDAASAAARLDAAVGVASSLVESWSARGAELEVGWTTAAGEPCLFRPRDRQSLDDTLDALACLESVGRPDAPSVAATEATGAIRASRPAIDLEIVLDAGPQPATEGSRHRAGRRLVIAFVPAVGSDVIRLPAAADAAAMLDRAFAEIGHDPDTTRS